jgi:hypothetical protein
VVTLSVRVKPSLAERLLADPDAVSRLLGVLPDLGVEATALGPNSASTSLRPPASPPRNVVTFPSPPGLRWEEVTFQFVSDTSVRVHARGVAEVYTFAEMGFKDGRRGDMPNLLWQLLRELARGGGQISWEHAGDSPLQPRYKGRVRDLRKRLRAVLGIKADPFYPYRKAGAYAVKFTLLDHGNREPPRPEEDDA